MLNERFWEKHFGCGAHFVRSFAFSYATPPPHKRHEGRLFTTLCVCVCAFNIRLYKCHTIVCCTYSLSPRTFFHDKASAISIHLWTLCAFFIFHAICSLQFFHVFLLSFLNEFYLFYYFMIMLCYDNISKSCYYSTQLGPTSSTKLA